MPPPPKDKPAAPRKDAPSAPVQPEPAAVPAATPAGVVQLFGVVKADGPGYAVVRMDVELDDERLVVVHTRLARPTAAARIESILTHEALKESLRRRRT